MSFEQNPIAGIKALGLVAFEYNPPVITSPNRNTLIFIGGLGDGLCTIPYFPKLSKEIKEWSAVEVLISSSYSGWGTGSLERLLFSEYRANPIVFRDAKELATCVAYFRKLRPNGHIVLMGHSTGCQDAMEYLTKGYADKNKLGGAIFQAPVSDRESNFIHMSEQQTKSSLSFLQQKIKEGKEDEIVPQELRPDFSDTPISVQRLFDLSAPLDSNGIPQGRDDYFSSDIGANILKTTFGKIPTGTKLLFLMSEEDEFVPGSVDKGALLKRWYQACDGAGAKVDLENGGILPGANHNFEGTPERVVDDLLTRIISFLESFGA